jgi:hypothetical protein
MGEEMEKDLDYMDGGTVFLHTRTQCSADPRGCNDPYETIEGWEGLILPEL